MAVPINLNFETGTEQAGQALGWTVSVVAAATLYADYGQVVFDATGPPDVDGLVGLPSWLTVTCPTAERSIQTGPATVRTGFAANTARARSLDGLTWGCAGEPLTTNAMTEQDLNNWSPGGTPVITSAVTPAGTTEDVEVEDDNAAGAESISTPVTIVIGTTYVLSAWTQVLAPAPSNFTYLRALVAPAVGFIQAAVETAWTLHVSATAEVATQSSSGVFMTPRLNVVADVGATRLWGTQLEGRLYPTSFMGADNATFTHAADVFTVEDPEVLAPDGYFALRFTIVPYYADTEAAGDHNLLWFDDDNRLFWDGAAGKFVLRLDGVDLTTAATTFSGNQQLVLTVRHKIDGAAITLAGATTGNGAVTGDPQDAITLPTNIHLMGTNLGAEEGADLRMIEVFAEANQAVEDFESGWGNTPLLLTIPTAELELAGYVAPAPLFTEPFESFQRGAAYLTEIGSKENATYGVGSTGQPVETFNEQWTETSQTFTANAGADEIDTSAAHLLTVGRMVRFTTTGTLPGNLTAVDPFYVITVVDSTTIQVSATPAGPLLDILDAGSGTHTIHAGTQSTALTTIPPAELELAIYDLGGANNAFESFEMADGWDASYVTTISTPTLALYFSGLVAGTQAFEDFESIRLRATIAVLPATDKILLTAHPFSNTEIVKFGSDGRLPAGLNEEVTYFVRASAANDFEVELVSGSGTAVDITDTGIQESRVIADETQWFTIDLGPV